MTTKIKKRKQFNDPLYNIFYPNIRDRVRAKTDGNIFNKISKSLTGELNSQFWDQIGYQIGRYLEEKCTSDKT